MSVGGGMWGWIRWKEAGEIFVFTQSLGCCPFFHAVT